MSEEAEMAETVYTVIMKKTLTLKSTLNFFKLSICFLWSGAMEGPVRKEFCLIRRCLIKICHIKSDI